MPESGVGKAPNRWGTLAAAGVLAAAVLAVFGRVLFLETDRVVSGMGTDMTLQFLAWRKFGFDELREGNLALWNPWVFCGAPFLGTFQPALLYPLNWHHLVMPLPLAVNCEMAVHVFLAGYLTFLWARRRGISRTGALAAGLVFMFSGPFFLHTYAGHLPHLAAMSWGPAVFLALDGWFADRRLRWILLGQAVVAMQILAGHPQYVYYTAVAAGIYTVGHFWGGRRRLGMAVGAAGMYAGAAALTAVQLLPGLEAARESVRGGGVSAEFSSMLSLPPESLLTLGVANLFGDLTHFPYFGRCYLWEVSLFIGAGGLVLAVAGAIARDDLRGRMLGVMAVALVVLALGARTPLFKVFYALLPGYSYFRGATKFSYLVCLFLAMLAGLGCDRLMAESRARARAALFSGIAAVSVLALAALVGYSGLRGVDGVWGRVLGRFSGSREVIVSPRPAYRDGAFIRRSAAYAATGFAASAAALAGMAVILWGSRHWNKGMQLAVLFCGFELAFTAYRATATIDAAFPYPEEGKVVFAEWEKAWAGMSKGDRVVMTQPGLSNLPMYYGHADLWGYDPIVPKRYAEFIAVSQGIDPDKASQYVVFSKGPPVYNMLRCRYALQTSEKRPVVDLPAPPVPRAYLVREHEVRQDRDTILRRVLDPGFDPMQRVILEEEPVPAPLASGAGGTVRIVRESTDELEIDADLPAPAILVVSDSYSTGWRVIPNRVDTQAVYRVVPANYCLRGIALGAGRHSFRLEYCPRGFAAGVWISAVALVAFAAICAAGACHGWRRRACETT